MTDAGTSGGTKRAKRMEEAVLDVDGVVGVRVWELADRVEIGVAVSHTDTAPDVLSRVMEVTEALRSPDEVWEVGILEDVS